MFGVHQHAMPDAEDDSLVIRLPDAPANVYCGIAHHLALVPVLGLRVATQYLSVGIHRHALRMMIADHHQLTVRAISVLAHMSLAAAPATERFVAANESFINPQIRLGYEEPFALAHERFVAPA